MKKLYILTVVVSFLILVCCRNNNIPIPEKLIIAQQDEALKILSLENESVIPSDYYQPLIEWSGKNDTVTLGLFSANKDLIKKVSGHKWRPEKEEFLPFLQEKEVYMVLYYNDAGQIFRSKILKIIISPYNLDESIVYRLVDPYFDPEKTSFIEKLTLKDLPEKESIEINNACIGCHSYSENITSFNIKRRGDRRFVYSKNMGQIKNYEQKFMGHFSFTSRVVDQRFMLVVANTFGTIEIRHNIKEPFDLMYKAGDIFCFDFEKEKMFPLPGASELDFVEDMPSFSPDGKKIIFSKYQIANDSIPDMDLNTIDFNYGAGGQAEIFKKSTPGEYLYFARFSPDSKWVSYCKGQGSKGIFAKSTSDIYLMNLRTGKEKKLKLNQPESMDSWHQWSADAHWLIFSSKRYHNEITSLYLTYIDESGNDSPPVKIYGNDSLKVNIPQFVNKDYIMPDNNELLNYINTIYTDAKN